MTHIWIEKAKVEQALEALKADSMEVEKYGKAITDLEQAIATEESSNAANAAATQRSASEHLEPVAKPTCSDERPCLPCYLDQGKCSATQEPQRTWVGLTDEEIMDVAFNFDVPSISLRTIEAKLKEKNT